MIKPHSSVGCLWICLLYFYIWKWKCLRSILVGAFLSRYRLWNWKLQFIILSFCFEPYSILSHGNVSHWVDSITLVTFARWIAWLNLWNIHTEKTLNSYLHSTSECRSLAIEGFPLTRLRNLQTWHNLELINCLNWLSDRMIVLRTWTKFACAYSEDLRIQTVPENFISFPRSLNIQLMSTNNQGSLSPCYPECRWKFYAYGNFILKCD